MKNDLKNTSAKGFWWKRFFYSATGATNDYELGPNWFASVMGTGIIANAAATLPVFSDSLHTFALVVWCLASFMLIGAYTTALMTVKLHTPFVLNLLAGMTISGIMGLIIGLPALRLKGFYLAIATMAFGIAVEQFVSAVDFFGGPLGIKNIPRFFPSEFSVYLLNLGFFLFLSFYQATIQALMFLQC